MADTNLAILFLADGDIHSATVRRRKTVAGDPDRLKSREILSQALLDTGRAKEAESHLRHALRYASRPAKARRLLARSLPAQDRPEEAIDMPTAQFSDSPDDVESLGLLAEGLVKTNHPVKAISVIEHQLTPVDGADVRNNLGIVLARTGRVDEAIRRPSKAVRMAPDNDVYRNTLQAVQRVGASSGNQRARDFQACR